MMPASIAAIEYHFPEQVLGNDQLAAESPQQWTAARIESKTGIAERRIAATDECASDLAAQAAAKLFSSGACQPAEIDYLLFCTQSPDYFLPTTACLLQERLGLRTTSGALDFNLGCSGFVYGLGLAKGLIESSQARTVLLLTAETYSKFIRPQDMNVRTLFGDGAAACLIRNLDGPASTPCIGPFVYGTDGRGAANLIVKAGGLRHPACRPQTQAEEEGMEPRLFMNGPEIFSFTLSSVPAAVDAILSKTGLKLGDIQLVVFHQANEYMLDHLRTKMQIPTEKFYIGLKHCGNTVSSTIPIALANAASEGRLKPGDRVLLVGFGVGYSWGAALVRWMPEFGIAEC